MIYLFNNKEELIHIIKEQDLIEFTHKIEINTFDAAEFELPIESIDKEIIEQMRFFGFFVRGRQFGVFKAYEVTMSDNYVVKGLDRAESDLRTVRIIKDKRLKSVTADQALNVALEGTGYQLGEREGLTKINKTNFYYISPREALVKIIEAFNCEFRVRYEFVENKIINRYIDLYHRQGSYSGVQFEYGNNALEVTMEEDSDNVVTALIGRGKGEESTDSEGNATGGYGRRIEFTDIVWTKASGKPIDKPAGQNYIVLNDDIENKGLYQNGELKHRWGVFVDEEIEDKEVLLQATYQELLRLNNPIRKYKASILDLRDDIWLGDRVAIVKDSAKLSFEARIFSITIDKLNFDQSEVELGDYETLKSRSQSSSLNAVKEAVRELSEEQEAYNRKVQEMIDNKNAEIAEKMRVMRLDMDNGIEDAKNKADKVKQEISDTIDQKISGFKQTTDSEIAKAKAKADEALSKAGTFPDTNQLSYQIKQQILNSPDFGTKVTQTFEQTENGETIYSKIAGKIEKKFITIDATDTRFRQASEQVDRKVSDAVSTVNGKISTVDGKISQANDNINNANSRIDATNQSISNANQRIDQTNQNLANTNATVAEHTRQIEVQVQNYNAVRESTKLYERIIGTSETDAPDKLSRLVMSSEIFQTEVRKYAKDDFNLVYDPTNFSKWDKKGSDANIVEVGADTKLLRITTVGKQSSVYQGFALPLTESTFTEGEKLSYRMELWVDVLPDRPMGIELWGADGGITSDRIYLERTGRQIVTGTMTVKRSSNKAKEFPFEIWLMRNGTVAVGKVSLIRGDTPPKYFFDNTSPQEIATKTQVTQLAGSYAIQNLNSAGDIISGVNLGADGTNRFVGKLTHITGETQIDNAVIKSAMVDKLKTGNFEAGSVTTQILASNSVTADKLLVDSAMINKLVSNQAFIRELTSQKAFITQLASIDISAEHIKGGRLSANTGSTVFDLDNGTLNLYSNTGTIRRIDDTSSSQFIKLTKSGFIAEQFRDSNAALMVIGTNHNKNPKEVERHDNETFAGIRLWSGKGNGKEESLTEFVGDRVLIYNNGPNRSPWNFHNNMQGKETYLLPMNENRVKHYIGRGDFFLEGVYSKKFFLAGGVDVGAYLWDLLTCFGMMVRHGMITNTTIKNHIQGILNGHGFR